MALRPRTRVRIALRAALRRRYGYAALRVLRRGLASAIALHFERSVGAAPYAGRGELDAIRAAYARAIRRLRKRWPRIDVVVAAEQLPLLPSVASPFPIDRQTQTNRRPPMTVTRIRPTLIHHLKCYPASFAAIKAGVARSTIRRTDDRSFETGDVLVFSRTDAVDDSIKAEVTGVEINAGPCVIYGVEFDKVKDSLVEVPHVLVHFKLKQLELLPDHPPPQNESERTLEDDDWRKVFSFAASAGDTVDVEQALNVIKAIALARVGGKS